MPRKKVDFDTVREVALRLPGVEDATAYGSRALRAHGKLLTCIPTHKSAEPDSLAVRIDIDRRAELIAEAPEVYYLTEHYLNYPMVLVRMSRIDPGALGDLLGVAWRFVTAKKPGRRKLTLRRSGIPP